MDQRPEPTPEDRRRIAEFASRLAVHVDIDRRIRHLREHLVNGDLVCHCHRD